MRDDEFEWDDAKAEANVRKHKIDFLTARRVFDDADALITYDLGSSQDEDRYLATGWVDGLLITVVHTERDSRIRIISARRANGHEGREYYRCKAPS